MSCKAGKGAACLTGPWNWKARKMAELPGETVFPGVVMMGEQEKDRRLRGTLPCGIEQVGERLWDMAVFLLLYCDRVQ